MKTSHPSLNNGIEDGTPCDPMRPPSPAPAPVTEPRNMGICPKCHKAMELSVLPVHDHCADEMLTTPPPAPVPPHPEGDPEMAMEKRRKHLNDAFTKSEGTPVESHLANGIEEGRCEQPEGTPAEHKQPCDCHVCKHPPAPSSNPKTEDVASKSEGTPVEKHLTLNGQGNYVMVKTGQADCLRCKQLCEEIERLCRALDDFKTSDQRLHVRLNAAMDSLRKSEQECGQLRTELAKFKQDEPKKLADYRHYRDMCIRVFDATGLDGEFFTIEDGIVKAVYDCTQARIKRDKGNELQT